MGFFVVRENEESFKKERQIMFVPEIVGTCCLVGWLVGCVFDLSICLTPSESLDTPKNRGLTLHNKVLGSPNHQ